MLYLWGGLCSSASLAIFYTLTYRIMFNSKHNTTKIREIVMGCNIWFRILVALGDHPNKVSFQWWSPSFFTLSRIPCNFSVSWWTVIRVLCPFFWICSSNWFKSSCCNSLLTNVRLVPIGVGDRSSYDVWLACSNWWVVVVVESPSLEIFKTCLDKVLCSLL